MARDPLCWLATTVRAVQKDIALLQKKVSLDETPLKFNAREFYPHAPPGVHRHPCPLALRVEALERVLGEVDTTYKMLSVKPTEIPNDAAAAAKVRFQIPQNNILVDDEDMPTPHNPHDGGRCEQDVANNDSVERSDLFDNVSDEKIPATTAPIDPLHLRELDDKIQTLDGKIETSFESLRQVWPVMKSLTNMLTQNTTNMKLMEANIDRLMSEQPFDCDQDPEDYLDQSPQHHFHRITHIKHASGHYASFDVIAIDEVRTSLRQCDFYKSVDVVKLNVEINLPYGNPFDVGRNSPMFDKLCRALHIDACENHFPVWMYCASLEFDVITPMPAEIDLLKKAKVFRDMKRKMANTIHELITTLAEHNEEFKLLLALCVASPS